MCKGDIDMYQVIQEGRHLPGLLLLALTLRWKMQLTLSPVVDIVAKIGIASIVEILCLVDAAREIGKSEISP